MIVSRDVGLLYSRPLFLQESSQKSFGVCFPERGTFIMFFRTPPPTKIQTVEACPGEFVESFAPQSLWYMLPETTSFTIFYDGGYWLQRNKIRHVIPGQNWFSSRPSVSKDHKTPKFWRPDGGVNNPALSILDPWKRSASSLNHFNS